LPAFAGHKAVNFFPGIVRSVRMQPEWLEFEFLHRGSGAIFTGVRAGMQVKPDQDAREYAGSVQAGCDAAGLG